MTITRRTLIGVMPLALGATGLPALAGGTERIRWQRVNNDQFEYAIQQGPYGDEFVKLLDGSCLRRSTMPQLEDWRPPLSEMPLTWESSTIQHALEQELEFEILFYGDGARNDDCRRLGVASNYRNQ